MRKSTGSSLLTTRLANFLFTYRLTPHATTGRSPAELLLSRQPRSILDIIRPDISLKVRRGQERQKTHYDTHCRSRHFNVDDLVLVKNFGRGPKWLKGRITECRGPLTYRIQLQDSRSVQRHVDHLQPHTPVTETRAEEDIASPPVTETHADEDNASPPVPPTTFTSAPAEDITHESESFTTTDPGSPDSESTTQPMLRRSERNHRPPDWFLSLIHI